MAKINIAERMREVLKNLHEFKPGIERDVDPECEDTWSADYAIIMLNVMEPEDDVREYFELDKFVHDFATHVGDGIAKDWVRLRGYDPNRPKLKTGTIVVHQHRLGCGWETEIEVYRIKKEGKVKSDTVKVAAKRKAKPKES